jgi:OmpA-OmpF porin, OOP family
MALFDSILNEVNRRFDLGDKASGLLSALLAFIADGRRGGLAGFLDLFDRARLGNVADSWVGGGVNTPLSRQQLEDALGAENLNALAKTAEIGANEATPALALMIPAVVDRLTPEGFVPENAELLSGSGYLLGGDEAVRAAPGAHSTAPIAERPIAVAETISNKDNAWLRALLPLILVALLVGVAFYTCRPNQPTQFANVNANTNRAALSSNANKIIATATTAKIDPRLSVRAESGKYFVSGVVASETERNQIIEAMRRELGADAVDFAGLRVDASARPAAWLAQFTELLPSLKGWTGSGELTFAGANNLRASGNIPQTVVDRTKTLFAGWQLPAIFLGTGADAQRAANEQAVAALETANTPEQVVEALNLSIINFDTGKSDVPADAQTILQKAAEVLKKAPGETAIEVGGHTDNQGNAIANQKLSEARAAAVKNALANLGVKPEILTAKGYGATKPKADNATEQGRFQNRRIEYTLTGGIGATITVNNNVAVTTNGATETHNSAANHNGGH